MVRNARTNFLEFTLKSLTFLIGSIIILKKILENKIRISHHFSIKIYSNGIFERLFYTWVFAYYFILNKAITDQLSVKINHKSTFPMSLNSGLIHLIWTQNFIYIWLNWRMKWRNSCVTRNPIKCPFILYSIIALNYDFD